MKRLIAEVTHWFFSAALPVAVLAGPISVAMAATADRGEDPAARAQAYLEQWNAAGAAACEAKKDTCPRLAESLYNAAIHFQAAGDREKAMSARQTLLNPRYHLEKTTIAKAAMFQLARDYQSLTEYSKAADQFEAAVKQSPEAREAQDALVDATVLQLAAGDFGRAKKNADQFDKLFGAKKQGVAASLWLAIGLTHIEKEQFAEAKAILEKIMGRIDREGELRDRFLAHTGYGRTLMTAGDLAGAEHQYAIVRRLWQEPENQKRILQEGETNLRNVGKVLTAVGEAMFFFAEQKRKEVEAIRYPVYTGSPDRSAVMKHVNTKVADWIKQKRPAIEAAEKNYRDILNLQPAAPPQWVVASANRIGTMWATFVAEFRAAPIPKEWTKNGPIVGADGYTYEELRQSYYAALDEASELSKQYAKVSFRSCVDLSVKYQYVDDFSRGCGAWLEKHYRKEFVPVTEMIPTIRTHSWNLGWAMVMPDPREK